MMIYNKKIFFYIMSLGYIFFYTTHSISLEVKVKDEKTTKTIALIPLSEKINKSIGKKIAPEIIIEKGDITHVDAQAIVNAANSNLLRGAGVCGAIFDAAGWNYLQNACKAIGSCPVGKACITPSYKLNNRGIKYIIHAVGPDCRISHQKSNKDELLYAAYTNSLIQADRNMINSVAFPFISSAIFAFPKKEACVIALNAIIDYMIAHYEATFLKKIHIVLFDQADFDLFRKEGQNIERKIPITR